MRSTSRGEDGEGEFEGESEEGEEDEEDERAPMRALGARGKQMAKQAWAAATREISALQPLTVPTAPTDSPVGAPCQPR